MNLYPVFPQVTDRPSLSVQDDRDEIVSLLRPPEPTWVRAIVVADPSGETIGADGSSASLTKGADRALLGLYRSLSDLVVVGASTLRRESVPTPADAPLAILSRSGNLSGHQLTVRPGAKIFVVTAESGVSSVHDTLGEFQPTVIALTEESLSSGWRILEALREHTPVRHPLIEGGQKTWSTFAGITDEVCLSVTPPLSDGRAGIPTWWPGNPGEWTLHSLWTDDAKMLYYRYRTEHSARPENS